MRAEQMQNYREMVETLLQDTSKLSPKEISFLHSLREWDGAFRPAQVGWLDTIYTRVTGEEA